MSKQRTDFAAESTAELAGAGAPTKRFRDTCYLSRTLVLEAGRTAPVVDSEIATSDPDWLAYLQQNPEFEPLE